MVKGLCDVIDGAKLHGIDCAAQACIAVISATGLSGALRDHSVPGAHLAGADR